MADDLVFRDRWGNPVAPGPDAVIKPRSAIHVVAISKNDCALLVWPLGGHGTIQLPGGGLEAGETHDDALLREWAEETGLPIAPLGPCEKTFRIVHGFYNENKKEFWIYDQSFWLCPYAADVTPAQAWRNPEGDLTAWQPLAALGSLPLTAQHRVGVEALLPDLAADTRVLAAGGRG